MFRIRKHSQGGHGLGRLLSTGLDLARTLAFPGRCPGCSAPGPDPPLCAACRKNLIPFESPHCTCCGHLFPRGPGENHLCTHCLETPLPMEKVRAAFAYQGSLKGLLPRFKYSARLSLAQEFESHLYAAFETHFDPLAVDLVLPIPLHIKKLRQRGFNQAYLLVRNFIRLFGERHGALPPWQINLTALERIRHTPPQTGFDTRARFRNMAGAFAVKEPDRIGEKRILLVDDVYTTGATCHSAARALLEAGAAGVDVLVLARA